MLRSVHISAFKTGMRMGHWRWVFCKGFGVFAIALLAAALTAFPAEANKKPKRSHYAPPQAAIVMDAYSGKILYEENADKPRFPASITKVMTLYLLFEEIRAGRLDYDSELKVSAEAASRPPSKLGLTPGSAIRVRDAMYALVTKSANDAAAVIAEAIAGSETAFARLMTQKARDIGMKDTTFKNASGLPDPGQTSTARDLVTLGRRVLIDFPEESKIFRTRYFQYGKARYKNHNGLLFSYAGMEGMKTGFTQASGFNLLASCRRHDKHLVAVVLGGRSSGHRNARMKTLLDGAWRKAVALNDLKQRGVDSPATAAAAVRADDMPERNPAFHGGASEQMLQVALAGARTHRAPAAETAAEEPRMAVAALAGGAGIQVETATEIGADGEAMAEEGDTEAESLATEADPLGPYHVQVGSYLDSASAKARLAEVAGKAAGLVSGHDDLTVTGEVRGKTYYRARFGKFSEIAATETCAKLKRLSIDCIAVKAQ